MKLNRYNYVKKNGVDFLFFSAPWVKKGPSSFSSKVSIKVIRTNKRKLNQKFFNSQDFYFSSLIRYYFNRYNEDKHIITSVSFSDIMSFVFYVLLKDLKSGTIAKLDLYKFIKSIIIFYPLISEEEYYRLNRVVYLFYLVAQSKKCKVNLFKPGVIRAENSAVFSHIRIYEGKSSKLRLYVNNSDIHEILSKV